jgi:hypothetical protein
MQVSLQPEVAALHSLTTVRDSTQPCCEKVNVLFRLSLSELAFMTHPFGYIDPGTGSLLWQSITAFVIGAGFYVRRLLARVRSKRGR